jgi:hypothetical protein
MKIKIRKAIKYSNVKKIPLSLSHTGLSELF